MVKSVWLEAIGTPGTILQIEVAGTFNAGDSPVYEAAVAFVIGTDDKIDTFVSGRYMTLRISSPDEQVVEPWRIASFTFEYEERGNY